MVWERELAPCNFLVKIFIWGAAEGELAAQHCVKKNSCRPNVSRWPTVFFFHYDFGTHVGGRSAEDFQFHFIWCKAAEAKVDKFNPVPAVDDNILQFYISMSNVSLMKVHQDLQKLLDDVLGFLFGELALGLGF